jgi:hypothetical protein
MAMLLVPILFSWRPNLHPVAIIVAVVILVGRGVLGFRHLAGNAGVMVVKCLAESAMSLSRKWLLFL